MNYKWGLKGNKMQDVQAVLITTTMLMCIGSLLRIQLRNLINHTAEHRKLYINMLVLKMLEDFYLFIKYLFMYK